MRTSNRFFIALTAFLLLFSTTSISQEDERPEYYAVTTLHWNMENENFNMDEWKAVEKEYHEKVTAKNEYIMNSGYYMHMFTADNRELLFIQSTKNWEGLDKASKRNFELEEEAWPDKAEREAFMTKRNAYYADFHSDEIYATLSGAMVLPEAPTEDMVLYIRKSQRAFPADGSGEEFNNVRMKFINNVIAKNEHIKAYYPSTHAWGANRSDFIEGFFLNSMGDLDAMFDRSQELMKEGLSEEDGKTFQKYFNGVHGDYLYSVVVL